MIANCAEHDRPRPCARCADVPGTVEHAHACDGCAACDGPCDECGAPSDRPHATDCPEASR